MRLTTQQLTNFDNTLFYGEPLSSQRFLRPPNHAGLCRVDLRLDGHQDNQKGDRMRAVRRDEQVLDRQVITEAQAVLGSGIYDLINHYIADTRAMLIDLELSRSAGAYGDLTMAITRLKSISSYVGARKVMAYAAEAEKILQKTDHKALSIEAEEKIDHYITLIREGFDAYQRQIATL